MVSIVKSEEYKRIIKEDILKDAVKAYVNSELKNYDIGYIRGIIDTAGLVLSMDQIQELEDHIKFLINLYKGQKQIQRALEISE